MHAAAASVSRIPPVVITAHDAGEEDKVMTEYQALAYRFAGVETAKDLALHFRGNGTVHYVDLVIQA